MKITLRIVMLLFEIVCAHMICCAQNLKLNDQEYFEEPGVNVLVYNTPFAGAFRDDKTAGIGLIHHGIRTGTGGAVRLQIAPEQWDMTPTMVSRKVDRATNTITVLSNY